MQQKNRRKKEHGDQIEHVHDETTRTTQSRDGETEISDV